MTLSLPPGMRTTGSPGFFSWMGKLRPRALKWLIQGYKVNGRARIKIGFPVSLLLTSEFFLLPSNKFIPKIVFDTQLAFPDKASVGKVGVRPGFFCTAGSPYLGLIS